MNKNLCLLLVAFSVSPVWAQTPAPVVGTVQNVQGLVTVSQGNTLGNAASGTTLVNGSRVVATSSGSALITLNNGCRIPLAPNQAVVVNSGLSCNALLASVGGAGVPAAAGPFAAGATPEAIGFGAAYIGVGAYVLANQSLSGN